MSPQKSALVIVRRWRHLTTFFPASTAHRQGLIEVQYTREDGKLHAVIHLPHGLHGAFRLARPHLPLFQGTLNLTILDSIGKTP